MSNYECRIARDEIVPDRKDKLVSARQHGAPKVTVDSLLMTSRSTDRDAHAVPLDPYHNDTQADKDLFTEILRKKDSDFIRLDLSKSKDEEINGYEAALKMLKTLV